MDSRSRHAHGRTGDWGEIKEIEFDEMWHFIESKKTNFGSSKPLIVVAGKLSPGVLGGRDSATFKRLDDKVKHLENCTFYTDDLGGFCESSAV
jgi:IS1 family transposase